MAAGNNTRGAVCPGEIVERPHDVQDELGVWSRDRVDRIVGMQPLRAFPGFDLDRGRGAQLRGAEYAVERVEHDGVSGEIVEHPRFPEQPVDAACAVTLEVVAPAGCRLEHRRQLTPHASNGWRVEHVLDDAVAVSLDRRCGHRPSSGLGEVRSTFP